MSNLPEYSVRDLFEVFVYLRRQGATPDYALQELKQLRPTISGHERDELSGLIRQWEKAEGVRHLPNPHAQIQSPPPAMAAPVADSVVQCPECGTPNPGDARYCYSCGTLLTRTGTQQLYVDDDGADTTFGNLSSLVFTVRGFEDAPISVDMEDFQEIIIGRTASDSVIVPDIDLTNYGASKLGVSRVHATLKRKDGVVTISDMGSVNNTYLNGERIFPQEIRVMRDGDEIRLGRLVMQVSFQRQLRRIR